MQKTKLGISVNLMAALVYLATLISGSILVAVILTGYILLMESDLWLRRSAVKAVTLFIGIGLLVEIAFLVPDFLAWLDTMLQIFDEDLSYGKISTIITFITKGLLFIRTVLMIALAFKVFKHQDMAVAKVDKIVDNNL